MKMTRSQLNKQTGFSTIEILIAFSVGIIFLTSAMLVSFSDPTLNRQLSLDSGHASTLDTILDTNALSTSTNSLGGILAKLAGNWGASVAGATDVTYTTNPNVTDVSPCMKAVVSTTTWNTLGRNGRTMTFGSGLSNLSIAKSLGRGGCDATPPTDWNNPDSFASFDPASLNIANAGIAATAIDVRTVAGHTYAFLTSLHASAATPDFWVIDVTNPSSPQYISSIDLSNGVAWGGSHKEGANDLVVIGNYAYILRNYNVDQLQVVNISDPAHPATTTPISFESRGVNKNGTDPQGEVIKYYNGKLYIGLHTTQGPEFLVYSIASNPAIPNYVGDIGNSFNHSIYDIAIKDSYAYLAIKPGSGGGAQNTRELVVLNVSAATPTDTGAGFNANNANNDTAGAMSLYQIGNKLYLGREQVTNPKKDFYLFDVSSPASPTVLGSANLGQTSNSAIQAIYVSGSLAFLGATKNPEFQTWNISNPTNITSFGCGGLDFPQEVTDIAYDNDYIFAAIRSNDFLRILKDETADATCN